MIRTNSFGLQRAGFLTWAALAVLSGHGMAFESANAGFLGSRAVSHDAAVDSTEGIFNKGQEDSLQDGYHIYFGNLHSHTSYSDGVSTPAHAFEHARDTSDIDFLAVTDHHTQLSSSEYVDILAQADAYNQDGIFVAIGGQEWTAPNWSHSTIWQADHIFSAPLNDFDSLYHDLLISGCTAAFCHPMTGCFDNYQYSAVGDVSINAVEVRNDYEEGRYIEILNNGWHVGADGSQDNHTAKWGDYYYWTAALACSLTRADILGATRNHRTYSTLDRNFRLTFKADEHWMGECFSHVDNIHFSISIDDAQPWDHAEYIALFQNGEPVSWVSFDDNSYSWNPAITPPQGTNYYFVKVGQEDGDRIWSSPIWIDCTTNLPSTPVLCSKSTDAVVTTLTPELSWHPSDSVDIYTLQYSTADDFSDDSSTVTISGIMDSSCTLTGDLRDQTSYYWRVLAANSYGSSAYSGTGKFFIDRDAQFTSDSEIRLTSNPADDMYPSLFQTTTKLWLVWTSTRDGQEELYYKTSSDYGASWSNDIRLTFVAGSDACPALAQDFEGKIWVVWDSQRDGNLEIYYKTYDGALWSQETRLTSNESKDYGPSIFQTADSLLWFMWTSNRENNAYDIYYKTFDGNSWTPATCLTTIMTADFCPEMYQMDNGDLWVVWYTDIHGCFYKVFNGSTWSMDFPLIAHPAHYPSITQTDDGRIIVAYVEGSTQDPSRFKWTGDIYYNTYQQQGGWPTKSKLPSDLTTLNKWSSVTQAGDGRVWMAYSSVRNGNEDIYAQRSILEEQPGAVFDLNIELEGGSRCNQGNVFLWWGRLAQGLGATHYVIYRSANPLLSGDSLADLTDTLYLDRNVVGDTLNYYYIVAARDSANNELGLSNRVGAFDRGLLKYK